MVNHPSLELGKNLKCRENMVTKVQDYSIEMINSPSQNSDVQIHEYSNECSKPSRVQCDHDESIIVQCIWEG